MLIDAGDYDRKTSKKSVYLFVFLLGRGRDSLLRSGFDGGKGVDQRD